VSGRRPRVGLFGRLGQGNVGNDVLAKVVIDYLRREHPDVAINAMCTGPKELRAAYGIEGTMLFWEPHYKGRLPIVIKMAYALYGKFDEAIRIAAWVRQQRVVIVPGMGVLEATLPLRPWEAPYAMFLLGVYGRLFRTKVVMISVGASPISQRATRSLFNWSARLANYRSFRDTYSRDAMVERGVRAEHDPIYPDLAFGLPLPPYEAGDPRAVGIGVMDYSGGNGDRGRSAEIRAAYVTSLKEFAGWLIGDGRRIRFFVGDDDDWPVAEEVLAYLLARFPGLDPAAAIIDPALTFAELEQAMQVVGAVVATRYHNVICAVRLAKPTIALTYAAKTVSVMSDAGLAGFCLPARDLSGSAIIEMFQALDGQALSLRQRIQENAAQQARQLDEQFALLSAEFIPGGKPARGPATRPPVLR
jgi:polysaccharide pyruvyl transferase WcaK-like protein